MLYGIEICTESRRVEGRPRKFQREEDARRWRDQIGSGGIGQSYGNGNSHRRIRSIYQMPYRWRTPKFDVANAIQRYGDLITT